MLASEIAHRLGAKRSGRQWLTYCVCHRDKHPSMIIFQGKSQVQFRCMAGCDPTDIVRELGRRGVLDGAYEPQQSDVARETKDKITDAKMHRLAMRLWEQSTDAKGTLGEQYILQRGLLLPPELREMVRFNGQTPRKSGLSPALVVLMQDVESGEATGVQRIYIDPATGKKDKCDASPNGSLTLGPAGAMMLTSWDRTYAGGSCSELGVCEGFETGLALYLRGKRPMWALGSAGRIRALPVLPMVERLTIWADHDLPGLAAAAACYDRWGKQRCKIFRPKLKGTDFADLGATDGHA